MGAGAKIVQLNPDLPSQLQSGSGTPSGAAGGDLGGSYPDPPVVALQGTPVCVTAPSLGNVLTFNGTEWCPAAPTAQGEPGEYFATDYGMVADGVTDDTAAWLAVIAAATASGTQSGTVVLPVGTTLIAGAIGGAYGAQINLPAVSLSNPQIVLKIRGASRPPFANHGNPEPTPGGYSIIKSLAGSGSGGAVFSGGLLTTGGSIFGNNLSVVLENLVCVGPDNPSINFWDLQWTQGGAFHDVWLSTVSWNSVPPQPTNSGVYGILLPVRNQSNYTYVDGMAVTGYFNGIALGELTIARGLMLAYCINGVALLPAPHASLIVDMQQTGCAHGLVTTGGMACDILQYDAEHVISPAWAVTGYDLNDPGNNLVGHIRWWGVTSGVGPDHSFTINGGANVLAEEIGKAPAGTLADPTTTEGDMLYRHSGAVTRLAVGASATVLHGGTDPAYSAVVEGDLSLSNVTTANVSTSKHGFAPILPNDATKYLDGTGAYTAPPGVAHYLVISSTHSTPLVFDDIVQSSAGDDFVYTS